MRLGIINRPFLTQPPPLQVTISLTKENLHSTPNLDGMGWAWVAEEKESFLLALGKNICFPLGGNSAALPWPAFVLCTWECFSIGGTRCTCDIC